MPNCRAPCCDMVACQASPTLGSVGIRPAMMSTCWYSPSYEASEGPGLRLEVGLPLREMGMSWEEPRYAAPGRSSGPTVDRTSERAAFSTRARPSGSRVGYAATCTQLLSPRVCSVCCSPISAAVAWTSVTETARATAATSPRYMPTASFHRRRRRLSANPAKTRVDVGGPALIGCTPYLMAP